MERQVGTPSAAGAERRPLCQLQAGIRQLHAELRLSCLVRCHELGGSLAVSRLPNVVIALDQALLEQIVLRARADAPAPEDPWDLVPRVTTDRCECLHIAFAEVLVGLGELLDGKVSCHLEQVVYRLAHAAQPSGQVTSPRCLEAFAKCWSEARQVPKSSEARNQRQGEALKALVLGLTNCTTRVVHARFGLLPNTS